MTRWAATVIAISDSLYLEKTYEFAGPLTEKEVRLKALEKLMGTPGVSMETDVDVKIFPVVDAVAVIETADDPNDGDLSDSCDGGMQCL